ncbi:MAG: AI-2E family transporter [Candidatus Moranbacteria bacterium]|jgi:predicted PurR-regulated permease PerM|nr:AI-2E family transporter [Candidatus Moranbacteria bacterium]
MQLKSLNVSFFFFLFLLVGVAVFFIFQPFLTAIVAAAILTALFKRPYHFLESLFHGHRGLSAFLTCLLVVMIIITPLFLVLSLAINEASNLYTTVTQESTLQSIIEQTLGTIQHAPYASMFVDTVAFDQERLVAEVKNLSQHALGVLQTAYQGVAHFVFWVFIMFFTLFYFLIDGKRALHALMQLSPLKNEHDKLLVEKFISISRATLKGTIVIGAIQGLIGGVAFWIAGVPSPAIWGIIMIILSVVPSFGTAIVWLPAGLILLALGHVWEGTFVLAIGGGVISLIDNILRPKLVGKDTQMHPLMVFFATIGGLSLFGLPGFIIGPIIIALFLALFEIYGIEFRDQLKEYNE